MTITRANYLAARERLTLATWSPIATPILGGSPGWMEKAP